MSQMSKDITPSCPRSGTVPDCPVQGHVPSKYQHCLNIHGKIITLQEDLIKYGLAENGQKIYIIAK